MAELEFKLETPEAGRVVAFPSRSFVIGSDAACAVCFNSELVAPRHAEVMKDTRGQWWVRDLVGNGAVAVNNTPVIDERLSVGDKLRIGNVVLLIQDTGVNAHSRTRSGDAIPAVSRKTDLDEDEPEFGPGTVIDSRYRIISKIAEGGMGEVYRGEHVELGKQLAIKVMLPELSKDQEFVGRFKREAIASSRIGHPNIIDISDFGQTPDSRFYFVMEFVEGKTLIKYRKEGPFRFERVVHVGLQMARALASAHAVNIIHRDLKPENIMLVQRPGQPDFVKVLDFGIAKVLGGGASGAFTAIGSVVGTPQYMAPEQASAGVVDTRSDIYSLGLILHELVRGRPTFTGDSAVELMSRQLDTLPPVLKSPWGNVPPSLDRIIMQMLEKDPSQRPASMEAVVAALEAVASTPTPTRTEPVTAVDLPGLKSAVVVPPEKSQRLPEVPKVEVQPKRPVAETRLEILTPPEIPAVATPETRFERAPLTPANPTPKDAQIGTQTARVLKRDPAVQSQSQGQVQQGDSNVDLAAVRPSRAPLIIALLVVVGGLSVAVAWVVTHHIGENAGTPPIAHEDPAPAPKDPEPAIDAGVVAIVAKKDPPPPIENNALVKVMLESSPERVEVYEEDILLGTTPLTLSRTPGTITALRFESKGYAALQRKLRFESDTSLKVELTKSGSSIGNGTGKKPPRGPHPPGEDDLKDSPF